MSAALTGVSAVLISNPVVKTKPCILVVMTLPLLCQVQMPPGLPIYERGLTSRRHAAKHANHRPRCRPKSRNELPPHRWLPRRIFPTPVVGAAKQEVAAFLPPQRSL